MGERAVSGWPMTGRVVLVTGATSGVGRATASALGAAGATVLVHARTMSRAREAIAEFSRGGRPGTESILDGARGGESERRGGSVVSARPGPVGSRFVAVAGDLGSLAGVREIAAQVRRVASNGLHVLINNAGAAFPRRGLSQDGVERTIAVNHIAVAALSRALLGLLRDGAAAAGRPSRVVNVSSSLERRGNPHLADWSYPGRFHQFQAYCDAKLINLAYSYVLAGEVAGSGITVNCADPGSVATGFGRNAGGLFKMIQTLGRPLLATPEKGARTGIRLAADPALDSETGGYYRGSEPYPSSAASRDPDFGALIGRRTAAVLGGAPAGDLR
ncbi:NAD(P)-dependent dehydrogenase (short-subunit alcohol dehydrogenase family) [Krasilnikovia cinnamomea]|uniref:NAD(P)-dependent dehydrogenase (Short-subunit alcohol dehydrogenase family) n=1 Tax=Krasilnikovia cinnamomea TaxID=349313 RepID=A0A4Q7ZJV3_9ACTN|nr:SDR family NAD(P)-dependent oxidoreductase [Krasilnikovia cinnamomea]RZU50794.1 NAD(P)-dependent dehydrogenase (short-subunit alcohol dehydrogenase family) [Krasilnikovia cinnamomea]